MNQEALTSPTCPSAIQNYKNAHENLTFPIVIKEEYSLAALQPEYAKDFFDLIDSNRVHLRKWLPWIDSLTTQLHALQFILDSIEENLSQKSLRLGLFHRTKIIGTISLLFIDYENQTCKIGYWIAESYQGNGIVTKACKVMLSIAFQYLGLKLVAIECGVENSRSRAIPERLGLKADKIIKNNELINGHYIDHMEYVMDFEQWENGNNAKINFLASVY
ncbi:MAG: GNAT family N-acetyltransferase [Alphaproteobacteria bacterium]|nr:GNAT family N-acetyltransferase [Alphaproteobacteria bacterium]